MITEKYITELVEELVAIECKLWRNDPVLYNDNLTEDAMIVFGETGIISRDTAVAAIEQENSEGRHWEVVNFKEARAKEIDNRVAALIYKVASKWAHEKEMIYALATSIYVKRGSTWKLVLHQQSPITSDQFNKETV